MTTHVVRNAEERNFVLELIKARKLPITVTITKGKRRSVEQNRLQRMWLNEASEQLGDQTPEELRAYCKLTIGIPILRDENDEFREAYDEVIRPLTYEQKLRAMALPLDFPVTRLMTTLQKKTYLDAIYVHFTGLGCRLTDPEDWR